MKVIFLDVDGVLINLSCWGKGKRSGLESRADSRCVKALNHVTDTTGAKIVVSSVWRLGGLKRIREILQSWGVTGKVIGVTPDLARTTSNSPILIAVERGDEIQAWLDASRFSIESFAIIDDDSDMKHLKPRLVKTEFEDGFTMNHASRAIELLSTVRAE